MSYLLHNYKLVKTDEFCLSPKNRSFLYGDGFFESIKVIDGKCFNLLSHHKRILESSEYFNMNFSTSFDQLHELLKKLIYENKINEGGMIRIVFFRDSKGKYLPLDNKLSFIAEIENDKNGFVLNKSGLTLGLYSDIKKPQTKFSNFKTTNAAISVFSSIYASNNGLDDCLLLNANEDIIESSNSNLFLLKSNTIFTPPLSHGCVNGTMRESIILFLKKEYKVIEGDVTENTILDADELFLSNSISGVRWVEKYKHKKYLSHDLSKKVLENIILCVKSSYL